MKKILSLLLTIIYLQTAVSAMSRDSYSDDIKYCRIDQTREDKRAYCSCNSCNTKCPACCNSGYSWCCDPELSSDCTLCSTPCAVQSKLITFAFCCGTYYHGPDATETCCCCGIAYPCCTISHFPPEDLNAVKEAVISGDTGPLNFFLTRYGATGKNKYSLAARLIQKTTDEDAKNPIRKKWYNIVRRHVENIDNKDINQEINISNFLSYWDEVTEQIFRPAVSTRLSQGTLLHFAAQSQSSLLMERLIKKGAAVDVFTFTPSIFNNHRNQVQLPVYATPLHAAIAENSEACIRLLIFAGADPDVKYDSSTTPRKFEKKMRQNFISKAEQERAAIILSLLVDTMPKELCGLINAYLTGKNKELGKEKKSIN